MAPILTAVGLRKQYAMGNAQVSALKGVSLELSPGEFVAVMGPSGSGKTTLLQLMAGLELPTEGEITLSGRRLDQLPDDERTILRRDHVGVVYQFFNLLPTLTARENVALPLMLAGAKQRSYRARVAEVLELVGLRERAEHLPGQLSGGEQQRVAIARALVARPAVVLADEPTGNLDRSAGEIVLSSLRRACDDLRQAIFLVTHDPQAASYADRVLFLRDGRVVDELAGPRPNLARIAESLARLEAD